MEESKAIIVQLQKVLNHLRANPYPYVPTPEGCKRRGSVAVLIRVRPRFKPVTVANGSIEDLAKSETPPETLDEFFSQSWVQEGDPEVLFIKRTSRKGDRWSGHIALPGGKRDPEDSDDISAAVRETIEEVGLDLSGPDCLQAGDLPQRIVMTTWGKAPLMVLCPYIFVFTGKRVQPVTPQPTEVASAHWVPLRALLSENLRTREHVDVASRLAKQGGWFLQRLLCLIVGKMEFSAVRLAPAQSIYASSVPDFLPEKEHVPLHRLIRTSLGIPTSTRGLVHQQPLILWGLTLGVLADFLDMLPPYNAVKLWQYPTFTTPDLRLLIRILTYKLRRNNAAELSTGTWPTQMAWPSQTASDATTMATAVSEAEPTAIVKRHNEVGIGGLGVGSSPQHAVGKMLSGYYDRVNVAIVICLVYRTAIGSATIFWLFRLLRRRIERS